MEEEVPTMFRDPARILVVDDEPQLRELLVRMVRREGHDVSAAEDGSSALERMRQGAFDLLLCDISMPGMDGYGVLQEMRYDPVLRTLPAIMISAVDDLNSVVRCIELGAEDYLVKPWNRVLLRARIDATLEKKRLRDAEAAILREVDIQRKRAESLLRVILPDAIAEELERTNVVAPRRHEWVAVLFCDLAGFTSYCDTHRPEEVLCRLQDIVVGFEELAERHNVQKIKTTGDAFMAVAGLLQPAANPTLNAARFGVEMLALLRERWPGMEARVGIHVGPVVAGVVGKRQYLFDVWGDTVNTAQRVEQHGRLGAVSLSAAAWAQVSAICGGRSIGRVEAKGKGTMELFMLEELLDPGVPGSLATTRGTGACKHPLASAHAAAGRVVAEAAV